MKLQLNKPLWVASCLAVGAAVIGFGFLVGWDNVIYKGEDQ